MNENVRLILLLKKRYKRLQAFVIALFLAVIAICIGCYMGYNHFNDKIKPQVEQSYPVPVEQLKEI